MTVLCEDTTCKYHNSHDKCICDNIKIMHLGKCGSRQKGLLHYMAKALAAMKNSNMISCDELNDDVLLGLYFIMKIYHLNFSVVTYGMFNFITLQEDEHSKGLTADEIIHRTQDAEMVDKFTEDILNDNLPKTKTQVEENSTCVRNKADLGYGWLSPMGIFTEAPYGMHEAAAKEICLSTGLCDEFLLADRNAAYCSYGDFLINRGYCLIHNPSVLGGAHVSRSDKRLTKAQREFLYKYFYDKGETDKAEQFLQE